MNFFYFLLICVVSMAGLALGQQKFNFSPHKPKSNLPEITAFGGGSRKQGFDVSVDARQKVWESQNRRHSVDLTGGYSQHLGGRYGNSPADKRIGAGYTFRF